MPRYFAEYKKRCHHTFRIHSVKLSTELMVGGKGINISNIIIAVLKHTGNKLLLKFKLFLKSNQYSGFSCLCLIGKILPSAVWRNGW